MYVCACIYGHAIHKHCFQQTSRTMPVFVPWPGNCLLAQFGSHRVQPSRQEGDFIPDRSRHAYLSSLIPCKPEADG